MVPDQADLVWMGVEEPPMGAPEGHPRGPAGYQIQGVRADQFSAVGRTQTGAIPAVADRIFMV